MFEKSDNPDYKAIYDKILETRKQMQVPFNKSSEMIKYLRDTQFLDFAVVLESDMAMYYANLEPCDLYTVTEGHLVTRRIGFAFAKGSSLTKEFNIRLLELQESQTLVDLERKWFRANCQSTEYTASEQEVDARPAYHVTLADLSGAMLILVVGLVLGGLVTAFECCVFKWAESVRRV